MTSNLKKIQEMIAKDKRVCNRLDLPLRFRYARSSKLSRADIVWSDFLFLDNVGGEGLGFSEDEEFSKGDKLDIELKLPDEDSPFYLVVEVAWISQNFKINNEEWIKKFSYGLKIFKIEEDDRKKFEQFIADNIIDKYLNDQGKLRDIEG